MISSQIKLVSLKSKNNLLLKAYDDNVYALARTFSILSVLVVVLYLILFFLGFVAGKIYILEAAAVVQSTFLSLIFIKSLPPTMIGLTNIKYIFGYNYMSTQ